MVTRKVLLAFAILAASLTGAALYVANGRASAAQSVAAMPMPAGWTAFDADWASYESGTQSHGRFYRASDGSFRREIYDDRKELRILDIVNITTKESFTYIGSTQKWRFQPVQYPETGYVPPNYKVRPNAPDIRQLPNGYEGLDAYERRTPDGGVTIHVPVLNLLAVRASTAAQDREQYTNIRIRPQNADLFRLPAGVTTLEKMDTPRIVLQYTRK